MEVSPADVLRIPARPGTAGRVGPRVERAPDIDDWPLGDVNVDSSGEQKGGQCGYLPFARISHVPIASTSPPPFRNDADDAFGYFLAGQLLQAGVAIVAVDGFSTLSKDYDVSADIVLQWSDALFDIECKRPQSVDCSVLVRPPGTLLQSGSGEDAEAKISEMLERYSYDAALFPRTRVIGARSSSLSTSRTGSRWPSASSARGSRPST
jgi:hypothetical protein